MPDIALKELIEAGVHFGANAARWDPRMKPYIHSKQNKIHIIDLRETIKGMILTMHFLRQTAAAGKDILFVGTKKPAQDIVREEGKRAGSHFVASRWLGGTLTNMHTMRDRILRLEELEALETSGELQNFSKKMISQLTRERKKIYRNFEGIRNMKKLPGAVVVVDPNQEHIAIAEAVKLNIPTVAILDTDCDPTLIDFVIPANDDAMRAIHCLVSKLADAVIEGKKKGTQDAVLAGRKARAEAAKPAQEEDPGIETPKDFSTVGGFSYGGDED